MNISTVSINRPVLASVVSIVIILFGVIGFTYLGVREYPSVDPPVVTVSTSYVGANSAVIEAQITEPLEAQINGIDGIKNITSSSSDGRSSITVEFELGIDMDNAANDVRDRVSRAIRNLPPDADPPIISKADANAETILTVTVQSTKRDLLELTDIANNVVKERLQTIQGVSLVNIWGEKRYAMRLYLDPKKLAAFNVTPSDIRNALSRENVELPTGMIEGYQTTLSIRTLGRLETPEEFNNLIIKYTNNVPVRVKDVGKADYAPENERTLLRGNGLIPMVGVALTPQPGANYINIADEAYKRVEQLRKELPEDITLNYAYDSTINIRKAISEVEETILLAFMLVVLVIFIFLRNWRTTLIPIIAIPISLIGTFFVMYLFGFTINILTLLGVVLATGIVVDDAIVVMENIYSKIEHGMDNYKAGYTGSKEIFFAIISTTITLVAVFMPIVFLQGITGRLFREFGVVVAAAVLISSIVSLTLTPMMSTRLLTRTQKEGKMMAAIGQGISWLSEYYGRSLQSFINRRWLAFVVMGISLFIIFIIGSRIPSELAPMEDKGRLSINVTAPEGTSFEAIDEYIYDIASYVDTIPEKKAMIALSAPGWGGGTNRGFVRLLLTQPNERERSQAQLADQISSYVRTKTFAQSYVIQDQTISTGRGGGLPVQFVVQAPNFEKLKQVVPEFLARAQADERFQVVDVNLKFNKPELVVEIDRDKARASGVTVRDVADALQLYFSGQRYGFFIRNGKQYYVIGQADRPFRDDPDDLKNIYVRSTKGNLVDLGSLIRTSEQSIPPQRYRYNRYISATFSASPAPGYTLGQGIDAMREISKEVLDDSFSTTLTGISQQFEESSNSLYFAFLLALILVYLVLAAQFESFRDPLIIMFTVPLALAGAVLSLWMLGHTLNIFSQIGIIVLVGIVTKNGILIVEFANQKKIAGMNKFEAVTFAAKQRLRPILMTSLATIFGTLPIALALGAASTSRIPMGVTIIGGLLFALILTLYVIPALYTYVSTKKPNVIRHDEE
ncbi:efflux RND transporter permease subunit [Tenuifilum sp.]|uniref:efflux RND transporter permease subunit n=4 Tax=Tenuifilum sp. TaxID=2760880 RepID=UPI002BEA6FD5|nr:efflux RND transporter permease subunit [Tenuifilum sp.]HOK86010.1 efflux RND transporter permease subunit [Tenuifilum sp.]HPP90342.1 efflux RND transporter permease subunit [Tenuifilum sp.]HQG72351.1 efflux RND transporter permease subunit [Tenuifilum sp.]